MKKFLVVFGFLIVCVSAAVWAADKISRNKEYTWHYKITVNIETPEGIKTGSAVREVHEKIISLDRIQAGAQTTESSLRGEAVVIDLGKRGVVFALLKGMFGSPDHAQSIIYRAFPKPDSFARAADYFPTIMGKTVTLELENYPMFVTFKDIKDPKTVVDVMEGDLGDGSYLTEFKVKSDNFEKLLGAGVRLKDVTVTMVDEPVTWGIEKWLGWLPERKNIQGYLGGGSTPPFDDPTKTYLNGIEFSEGKFW